MLFLDVNVEQAQRISKTKIFAQLNITQAFSYSLIAKKGQLIDLSTITPVLHYLLVCK
jgi:hypothetical protein